MADTSWYYTHGGHRMGPVPLSELQSLVASTRMNNQELAWTAGMGDWARVIDLPILRNAPFRQRMLPAPAEAKPPTIDSGISTHSRYGAGSRRTRGQRREGYQQPKIFCTCR